MRKFLIIAIALAAIFASTPVRAQILQDIANAKTGTPPVVCGGTYQGPGDIVASNWFQWVGLRAFSAATCGTKAINLCNGGTCADINSVSTTGLLDLTAVSSLGCTNNSCTIAIFYDQSGNARDINTSTSAGTRPTLAFGSTNCTGTAGPCADYQPNHFLDTGGTTYSISNPATAVVVEVQSANTGFDITNVGHSTGVAAGFSNANNKTACWGAGSRADVTLTNGTWAALQCVSVATTSNASSSTVNGSTTTFTGGSGAISGQALSFGGRNDSLSDTKQLEEGGINTVALNSTQLGNLNTNMHTYALGGF